MKSIPLGDLFTNTQLEKAADIIANTTTGTERHRRLCVEIVEPRMAHINKATGQENNAGYFAYVLEHVLAQESQL